MIEVGAGYVQRLKNDMSAPCRSSGVCNESEAVASSR